MAAIELSGVGKEYGSVRALESLDLTVEEGEIYGFLGPNGAGKSTTINVVLDFVRPTTGTARVFGVDCQDDPRAVHERIGVLPEGYDVFGRLTGRKHVEYALDSKDADGDPDALLERVGLADGADRKAGGYSKGMAQRLVLAMALAGEPDLLILDEPTTGLDPNGARAMREVIREEVDRGATVFFSSHILEQVEAVCDRVGILNEGRLVAEGDVETLRAQLELGETLHVSLEGSPDGQLDAVRALDGVESVRVDGTELAVGCTGRTKLAVLRALEDGGLTVADFSTERASLERLFESYTVEEMAAEGAGPDGDAAEREVDA